MARPRAAPGRPGTVAELVVPGEDPSLAPFAARVERHARGEAVAWLAARGLVADAAEARARADRLPLAPALRHLLAERDGLAHARAVAALRWRGPRALFPFWWLLAGPSERQRRLAWLDEVTAELSKLAPTEDAR